MAKGFEPGGLPLLIGSLPLTDHEEAVRLVLGCTPRIPLWPQLPAHPREGMMAQFLPGMPGLAVQDGRQFIDMDDPEFDLQMLGFYEDYMAVTDGDADMDASRFALQPDTARGFFTLEAHLTADPGPLVAVKGQVTGPITLATGVADRNRRAIFYHDQTRDAAVKLLALKARWQVRRLSVFGRPVIVFIDEPALAGFGSSEMISISREAVTACLDEVVQAIHQEGGLAGIHVCANTDWSLALCGGMDIVNFDAYAYFDRFILYPELIEAFVSSGGILAWGIVPTLSPENLDKETVDSLTTRWEDQARAVAELGVEPSTLLARSLITPSCGAGSLSVERALRVLELTRGVSDRLRAKG